MSEHDEVYLRSHEMASYLRIGRKLPVKWRWLRYGPPYIKAGRAVLYRRRDLDAWLESRECRPTSEDFETNSAKGRGPTVSKIGGRAT